MKAKKGIKKDQVLYEYLRAEWLRLVGILPDLYAQILPQTDYFVKTKNRKLIKIIFVIALYILHSTLYISPTYAQTPATWQNNAAGLQMSTGNRNKTAGLGMIVENKSWPALSLGGGVINGNYGYVIGPSGIDLGFVKITGTATSSGTLSSQTADWAHNTSVFQQIGNASNRINLTASRLSSAVLVQSQASSLDFLTGPISRSILTGTYVRSVTQLGAGVTYPKYVAYPTSSGIRVNSLSSTGVNLSDMSGNWILVWYGNTNLNPDQSYASGSYFLETKNPILYPYYREIEGRSYYLSNVNALPSNSYQADAPILFVLQNVPNSIRHSADGGIEMVFPTTAGYVSLLPLYGKDHLTAQDTESWSSGLPSQVVSKINTWASYLCNFPSSVSESYSYDSSSDTARITESINFTQVCPGGTRFAPLPPMLGLARNALGANLSFSSPVTDGNLPTEFGPSLGIENTNTYTWSITGLKKYTDNKRNISNGSVPSDLQQELVNQVNKVVASGHMRPWIFSESTPRHLTRGDIYWMNPADAIYQLSEIADALPNTEKNSLTQYIKDEKSLYSPEIVPNVPLNQGASRGNFALSDTNSISQWTTNRSELFLKRVPLYNFLGLAKYYELTGEDPTSILSNARAALNSDMQEQDWATMYWFKGLDDRRVAVWNANRHFAGLLGVIRLTNTANTPDMEAEALARVLLAKAAVLRLGMSVYPSYLYTNQLVSLPTSPTWQLSQASRKTWGYLYNLNWVDGTDDIRQVITLDQFWLSLYDHSGYMEPYTQYRDWGAGPTSPFLAAYRDVVPELARLLNDFVASSVDTYINKLEGIFPHWYLPYSDQYLGTEHNIAHPIDSYQTFMVKAFLAKESSEKLAHYSSYPWIETGDFFYMQKLAETIKAYQGWTWSDTLTADPCTISSLSWDANTAQVDTQVSLVALATGNCSKNNITFEVRRNGTIFGVDDIPADTQPVLKTLSFVNNKASTAWTTEHNPYWPGTDPDYYFRVSLDNESTWSSIRPSLLTVTKPQGGIPSPTPAPTQAPTPTPMVTVVPTATPTPTPTSGPTPTPGPVSAIFSDGFEGGNLTNWTNTSVLGTGSTLNANAASARSGGSGLDAFLPATAQGNRAVAYRTVAQPASKQLWGKLDVNLRSPLTTQAVFLTYYSGAPVWGSTIWVSYNSTTSRYRFNIRGLDGNTTGVDLSSSPTANTWQTWKWNYDWSGSAITAALWIDGTQVAQITDSTTGTFYLPQAAVGIQDWWSGRGLQTYFDNVNIYDSDPDAAATPTPSSSPTSTPTPTPIPTATPTPSPTPVPCTLSSASWGTAQASVVEGTSINLNVTGSGNECNGQTVNLTIYEDDLLGDDTVTTVSTTFNNSQATTSWTTTWQQDINGLGGDPEYFFTAVTGNSSQNSTNLTVTQSQGGETGLAISSISSNASTYPNSQVPKFDKFEATFQVNNTVATNLQMPYDTNTPAGVIPGQGITVNAQFSQDNFQTYSTQPAFYYQDFDYQVKGNRDWIYPTSNYSWKVRFAPNKEGTWQYRLTAQDSSGTVSSPTQTFTVSSNPNNHGFVKVSKTDTRYFEYEDGTYFPGLGYNLPFSRISWDSPVLENQDNFRKMNQNGIQLIRHWFSEWSVFGSQTNPWNSTNLGSNAPSLLTAARAGAVASGSDTSMEVKWSSDMNIWPGNPCMFLGWMKNSPAAKPNTSYHISVRYQIPTTINGPYIAGQPYGLVAKFGGWLVGSFALPNGWPANYHCGYPAALTNQINPGLRVRTVTPYASTATNGWATLEADFTTDANTTGASDFLPFFYLGLENIAIPSADANNGAYIDRVEIKENLGNNQYGPNILSKPWMSHLQYFDQKYSYNFDKVLDLAKQNDVYLKLVALEKNEFTQNSFDYNGNPTSFNNNNFYGNWGSPSKVYWLQQAYWRYLQARWGYSTNIHSWELLNEGDPYNGLHHTLANNFAKYMHQFGSNSHLVTTSNWNMFPINPFWGNSNYQDLDYVDIHQYITEGQTINLRVDKPTGGAAIRIAEPADFYDSAAEAYKLSMQLGAKQPYGVNKPIMRGETGFTTQNSDGWNHGYFNTDTQNIWLHKYIWGGINSGGLLESYWYATEHIYSPSYTGSTFDKRPTFKPYYDFIKDIPLSNGNYQEASASATNTNIRAWGQKDTVNGKAHLWIDNSTHTWGNVVNNPSAIATSSGTVTIPNMPAGTYTASWFDTYGGTVSRTENVTPDASGNITLTVNNLSTDTAVKLENQSIIPSPSPSVTPTPCTLTSASWSASNAVSGTPVTMTVSGNNCNGQTVNFLVRENDSILEGGLDEDASVQPSPNAATIASGSATLTWNATYMQDGLNGISDPPEFFFNATVGTQSIRSQNPLLTVTKAVGSTIDQYGVFEDTFTHSTTGVANPWNDITVSASFTSPSGKVLNIDGFFYDANTYKIRFTPTEIGSYTYTGTINGGPSGTQNFSGSFTSISSSNKGFIRKYSGSPYKLQYENGSLFYGIGFNDCWGIPTGGGTLMGTIGDPSIEPVGEGGEVDINAYFQKYNQEGGFNLFRWNPYNCSFGIYPGWQGSQSEDIRNEQLGDQLLSAAKSNGFHVMFTFFSAGGWVQNAPTDSQQDQQFKRLVRYILARYGPYVDIWEWNNESDPNGNFVTDAWLQYASDYMRSIDPYQRLITNSHPRNTDSNFLDVKSPHIYYPNWDFYSLTDKSNGLPVIPGEIGRLPGGAGQATYDVRTVADMRMAGWTGFFGGSGLIYWNSSFSTTCCNQYIGSTERRHNLVLKNFIDSVPIDADAQAAQITSFSPSAYKVGYALTSTNSVVAYVYDSRLNQSGNITTAFTLNIPFAGTATWIDPKTGNSLGTSSISAGNQTFTTPTFAEDIALKIVSLVTATPIPPTATPTPVPCSFTANSASWSTTTIPEASSVNLTVTGSSSCTGQTVNFNIKKNNLLADEDITSLTATFSATLSATASWTTPSWFDDCGGIDPRVCNPSYHFDAVSGSNSQKSNDLTVTQSQTIPTSPTDWPQVQKDPQHTGYSPEVLGTNIKVAWTYPFAPERIHPQVQAIIYQSKVFVGTENGNMYALDATQPDPQNTNKGRVVWKTTVGGPIVNSVAADNGKIYFGALNGSVYAIYTDTENGHQAGAIAWEKKLSTRSGFSSAPVFVENKIMIGGRNGVFYALNPDDGRVVWEYKIAKPILMTAAYDQGKVFFGAMDMYVYALNTLDGALAWKSQKIPGQAFKDYWPVVTQGKVFIIPHAKDIIIGIEPGFPFGWYVSNLSMWDWIAQNSNTLAEGNASTLVEFMNVQDNVMASYQANPTRFNKNMYILDENTGEEVQVVPHMGAQTHSGTTPPPCVDREGKLIIPVNFWGSGWGRLDVGLGRITDVLYDGYNKAGKLFSPPFTGSASENLIGFGNADENYGVSCTNNSILSRHVNEAQLGAGDTGVFNLDTRRWTSIGTEEAHNKQMMHNTQGGGTNPFSVSNGMIYDVVFHTLMFRTTN